MYPAHTIYILHAPVYLLWPALTIAEAGLHVLDSTDSTLCPALYRGGGGGWEEGFPAPAPPPHQRQCGPGCSSGGRTFTLQPATRSLAVILSYLSSVWRIAVQKCKFQCTQRRRRWQLSRTGSSCDNVRDSLQLLTPGCPHVYTGW